MALKMCFIGHPFASRINHLILKSISLLSLTTLTLNAQVNLPSKTDDPFIQQQLENIAESSDTEEADFTNLLEGLIYYRDHPLDLNHANKEELQELQLLNDFQINNLLSHIKKNGKLITIYELQTINGFDLPTIQKILPYITISENFNAPHFSVKEMFRTGQNILLLRYSQILETQTGFTPIDSADLYQRPDSRYVGSPQKIYTRYRFAYGTNVSWGITAEKDQGELFFKHKQKYHYDWYNQALNTNQKNGFDFYSAHFYLRNLRFIKSLAIGDYQATFGQGLTAWTGYAFGKGSDIINIKKNGTGIRPYTSTDENRFMRGLATTIRIKKIEMTGFFSRKKVDGKMDTLSTGETIISSLQETGYHTTLSEIAHKHSASQTIYGGNVSYKARNLTIGFSGISYHLDKNFQRNLSFYNQFEFSSGRNINFGLDYNFIIKNFNFFGETSVGKTGGKSYINGLLINIDPRISFAVLHRNYQHNYQNLVSNAFSENLLPANEKGLFLGILTKPTFHTTLTAYCDHFKFPWLKYQRNSPSKGNDYFAQLNFTPSKKMDVYVRWRQRNKEENKTNASTMIDYLVAVKQCNYRISFSYTISNSVKLRNRLEFTDYKFDNDKTQTGFLIYQDIIYHKMNGPVSVTLRYALFQTDNYDTRIYVYENDVPGSYSIPSFYYRGSRFYILLNYSFSRSLEFWIRYSQSFYDNRKIISENSLTEINGNTKTEIKAQIKFKF